MPDDVLAFLHALQMQNIYALQKHHLQVDYAAHARRIWIGETKLINGGLSKNPRFHLDRHHFSLLAPVLLASQSLAVDVTSLYVLDRCIEHAWKSHTRSNIDESSTLPWSVKTLTLAGCLAYYRPTCTAEGYAFLASISHIIFLSPTSFYRFPGELLSFDGEPNLLSRDNLPERMNKFPWTYLKSIQSVSLVLPDRALKSSQFHHWSRLGHGWRDEQVELLRFSSPTDLLSGLDNWPVKIADEYFARRRDGRDIPLVHIRATATCCSRLVIYVSLHWEQAWAYEL
jgi:hypothetical protein